MTDQSLAHAVERLQVKLVGGLGGDELHGWALHASVSLLRRDSRSFDLWNTGGRILPALAVADTGLHPDRARRQVDEPGSTSPRDHFCRTTMPMQAGAGAGPDHSISRSGQPLWLASIKRD